MAIEAAVVDIGLLFVAVVIQNDKVRIVALDPLYLQKDDGFWHARRSQCCFRRATHLASS